MLTLPLNPVTPASNKGSRRSSGSDLFSRHRRDAMLMAFLSFMVVLHRRFNGEPWQVIAAEAATVLTLFALAFVVVSGWLGLRNATQNTKSIASTTLVGLAVLVPTFSRLLVDRSGSIGAAWEMVMLTTLGLGAATLVFCSRDPRHSALSVICSGFLVLFTSAISDHGSVLVFTITWVVLCLYWLVANHWERLEVHMAQSIRRERTLRFGTTTLGIGVCVLSGLLMFGREPATRLLEWGFMPTSGGQQSADASARSGVGDGDAIVAAKEHAASFGPVESELFLESDMPSLFDMFDDTIGEAFIKRRNEKAVALANQSPAGEEQKKYAKSEKGNAGFSTAREPANVPENMKDKTSPSILQWVGPAGVSLAMERFDRFDGVDWSKSKAELITNYYTENGLARSDFTTEKGHQAWYFRKDLFDPHPLQGETRSDAVKFINLKSPRIPAPVECVGVHIADVDRDDFFAITSDDSWIMPDRLTVPQLTVARLVSRELDGDALHTAPFPQPASSWASELETDGMKLAGQLAKEWTKDLPRGWPAIEQIIERLRQDFVFDRQQPLDPNDPLSDFLNRKRGGDHLFSSAAVAMLQSQGYEARLVTGFYADRNDIDIFSGHVEIGKEDVHVWAEVLAADQVWVPLEPTPAYDQPRFYRTLWNRAITLAGNMLPWFGLTFIGGLMLWLTRAFWGEAVCQIVWKLSRPLGDRWRLAVLIRLLDVRTRLAGAKRPRGVTPRRWFVELASRADESTSNATRKFFDAADVLCYGPNHQAPAGWINDAHQVARRLTVRSLTKTRKLGSV
jgi:hypothetical protein